MNTPPEAASARLFANVLRAMLGGSSRNSDLLIPRRDLGALLPVPCANYLEQHGGQVALRRRVTGFETDANNIVAVHTGNGRTPCRQLILATPHTVTRRLLSRHPALAPLAARMSGLGHAPIATVYVHYPPDTRLPLPLAGFENALSQWVFDRRVCGQPGLMAVVISAQGTHLRQNAAGLIEQVAAELALAFPHWPAHREGRVLREKRATFHTHAGVDLLRPDHRTPVGGLWLAGDYTATDLPATLEGAVRSGLNCARAVRHALYGANMLNFRDAYT
jgi:predicted NAD/FAD-dependent oxidoreductase